MLWVGGDNCLSSDQSASLPPITYIKFTPNMFLFNCICINAFMISVLPKVYIATFLLAGIDTDKNKYPIGSGRVTFNNVRSYVRAISAAYVEIYTDKFTKKVRSLINLFYDPFTETQGSWVKFPHQHKCLLELICVVCKRKESENFSFGPGQSNIV